MSPYLADIEKEFSEKEKERQKAGKAPKTLWDELASLG